MAYMDARNQSVAVADTSVLICPSRARSEITITNTGTTNITLSFGTPAVAGAGVFLVPNSVYFANNNQGFLTWNGEIFAIGSAAGGTLAIFER